MKLLRTIAFELGKGLLAGLAGAAAMTVASTIEMKLRGRPPSTTPVKAAEKVLGIAPRDEAARQRLGTLVHYAYGSTWGLARSAINVAGVRGRTTAPLSLFAVVWLTEMVMLPALRIVPPPWKWGTKELAIDALHHTVYAGAADAAYRLIDRR